MCVMKLVLMTSRLLYLIQKANLPNSSNCYMNLVMIVCVSNKYNDAQHRVVQNTGDSNKLEVIKYMRRKVTVWRRKKIYREARQTGLATRGVEAMRIMMKKNLLCNGGNIFEDSPMSGPVINRCYNIVRKFCVVYIISSEVHCLLGRFYCFIICIWL